jgi:hypothetical protein
VVVLGQRRIGEQQDAGAGEHDGKGETPEFARRTLAETGHDHGSLLGFEGVIWTPFGVRLAAPQRRIGSAVLIRKRVAVGNDMLTIVSNVSRLSVERFDGKRDAAEFWPQTRREPTNL